MCKWQRSANAPTDPYLSEKLLWQPKSEEEVPERESDALEFEYRLSAEAVEANQSPKTSRDASKAPTEEEDSQHCEESLWTRLAQDHFLSYGRLNNEFKEARR